MAALNGHWLRSPHIQSAQQLAHDSKRSPLLSQAEALVWQGSCKILGIAP